MSVTFDNPAGVAAPIGSYSHVARIDLGAATLLFVSGQVALGPDGQLVGRGDPAAQADQVFANIQAALEAHGAALRDIVKLTTYLTDIAYRAPVAEVRARVMGDARPTSTLVAVSALATPDYLVEIEAVAVART
jgi:enamine deaminase RidA (YjgF/YER057c/UK114 family)